MIGFLLWIAAGISIAFLGCLVLWMADHACPDEYVEKVLDTRERVWR